MPDLQRALEIAVTAHKGQVQKSGAPYVLHPLRLMFLVDSEEEQIAAVLHDVVEDTHWELAELKSEGFSQVVLDALDCLTHQDGVDYKSYIEKVASNSVARAVKLADLRDNMNVIRLPEMNQQALDRIEKYHKAWLRLGGTID